MEGSIQDAAYIPYVSYGRLQRWMGERVASGRLWNICPILLDRVCSGCYILTYGEIRPKELGAREMETQWVASGYKYNPKTRQWNDPVEYLASNKLDAIRWCSFNRDWLKYLGYEERTAAE